MAGFFKKLFGGGKKADSGVESLVQETLSGVIERAGFDLDFDLKFEKNEDESVLTIEFSGADEETLKDKKGQLLDAFQLFIKRVIQHNFPEDKTNVLVDAGGYREETEQALIDKAEDLKRTALEQGRSVYYRALPPKERKIVHQYLSQDPRIKSRSLGDGLYKKIKIYPAKNQDASKSEQASQE
ncbi:MAG: protein jag [Bdellovibrionales bacterium]